MKAPQIIGLIGSALLLVSGVAHLVLGWPAVRAELTATHVPADVTDVIMLGWQFGGLAMIVLSGLMGNHFLRRWNDAARSRFSPVLVGTAYVLFGSWAIGWVGFQPFYLIFIIPGLLLVFAALGDRLTSANL